MAFTQSSNSSWSQSSRPLWWKMCYNACRDRFKSGIQLWWKMCYKSGILVPSGIQVRLPAYKSIRHTIAASIHIQARLPSAGRRSGFAAAVSPLTANSMSGQGRNVNCSPNVNTGNKFGSIHLMNTGCNSGNQVNNQGNRGQQVNNYVNLFYFAAALSPLTPNNMSGQGPNVHCSPHFAGPDVNTGSNIGSISPINTGCNFGEQSNNYGNQLNNQGNRGTQVYNQGTQKTTYDNHGNVGI